MILCVVYTVDVASVSGRQSVCVGCSPSFVGAAVSGDDVSCVTGESAEFFDSFASYVKL